MVFKSFLMYIEMKQLFSKPLPVEVCESQIQSWFFYIFCVCQASTSGNTLSTHRAPSSAELSNLRKSQQLLCCGRFLQRSLIASVISLSCSSHHHYPSAMALVFIFLWVVLPLWLSTENGQHDWKVVLEFLKTEML